MHKYEVILYWSDKDHVFIAEVPELPEYMAHGDAQLWVTNGAEKQFALLSSWAKRRMSHGWRRLFRGRLSKWDRNSLTNNDLVLDRPVIFLLTGRFGDRTIGRLRYVGGAAVQGRRCGIPSSGVSRAPGRLHGLKCGRESGRLVGRPGMGWREQN